MPSASDRVVYQNKPMDRLTYERLRSLTQLVKSSKWGGEKSAITLIQGIGGAAASAGTHSKGGCFDITAFNYKNRVLGGRLLGGADWYRPDLPGVWSKHIHGVTAGVGYAALSAQRQVTAYYAGRNGLANNGRDTGPRLTTKPLFVAPWTDRGQRGVYYAKRNTGMHSEGSTKTKSLGTLSKGQKFTVIGVVNVGGVLWAINVDGKHAMKSDLSVSKPTSNPPTTKPPVTEKKISLRMGQFNFPGPDKQGNEDARIKRGVALIKAQNLDVVTFNELVGPGRDGASNKPSAFAQKVLAEFGREWSLITPTTAWNENYILYRLATVDFVSRAADTKIYVKGVQGKHVTHAILKDKSSGKNFSVNATHLVSGNEPGAAEQAKLVWSAVARVKGDLPAFILGDMNTDQTLVAFIHAGQVNARLAAVATTAADYSTYAKWSDPTPNRDSSWIIDHLYVPSSFKVKGYTVVLDDKDGKFITPRPSDHMLVIISVIEN